MKNESVIVIGNGPNILDKKNGVLIDSFDVVVRCNILPLGFDEYVGIKKDVIYVCHPPDPQADLSGFKKVYTYIAPKHFDEHRMKVHPGELITKEFSLGLAGILGYDSNSWATTGMLAIWHMLSMHEIVHITGFNFYKDIKYYFEAKVPIDADLDYCTVHHGDVEEAFIRSLIKDGRIKIL